MKKEKRPIHRVQMTDGKRNIIQQLLQEYDIKMAEDIHDPLKDLLGGTIKDMIVMTIEMVTSTSKLTVVMVLWKLKYHKIENLLLNLRL